MDCPTCSRSVRTESGLRQHHSKVHGESLPNRTCADCGVEFYDPKSQRKYCDNCNPNAGKNNGNWSDSRETAVCRICETRFDYYPSNKQGVYCSRCVEQAVGLLPKNPARPARITTNCEQCGSILRIHEWRRARNSYRVFCSSACYGQWLSENIVGENHHQWKGGSLDYGTGWWKARREALERDDYRCVRCEKTADELEQNPDVHHIKPVREFENPEEAHTLTNLVSLCRSCHCLVESDTSGVTRFKE